MSALLAVMALVAAAFVQPDATCVMAGVLAASGHLDLPSALIGSFIGTLAGDITMISVGRFLGWATLDERLERLLVRGRSLVQWRDWVREHAAEAVFFSRFLPGLSMAMHWLVGIAVTRVSRLIIPVFLTAVIYVAVVVGGSFALARTSGRLFGSELTKSGWAIAAFGLAVWCIYRSVCWLIARRLRATSSVEDGNDSTLPRETLE